jgi:hypothetical protein
MSLYDYSNGQLINELPDIEFTVLTPTSMSLNTEIADVAEALHGEKLHSSRPRFSTILKFILKQLRSY